MSRDRIITAARSVFASKGYTATSLREIAQAVGIKTPSIYAHFESKKSLFETVYEQIAIEHTEYFAKLSQSSAELPPIQRVQHLLRGVNEFYADRPEAAEFSLRTAADEQSPELPSLRRIFLDFESSLAESFRSAYRDGQATGVISGPNDEDGFVALALLLMDGLFLQRTHYSQDLYEERFEFAWNHLVSLLSTKED